MNKTDKEVLKLLRNKDLWRAPSFSVLMKHTGLKSKNAIWRVLQKLQSLNVIDKNYKPTKK